MRWINLILKIVTCLLFCTFLDVLPLAQVHTQPLNDRSVMLMARRGHLHVALEVDSPDYFLFHATPLGYQLTLAAALADTLGCELDVVPVDSYAEGLAALKSGRVELYAAFSAPDSCPAGVSQCSVELTAGSGERVEEALRRSWLVLEAQIDLQHYLLEWVERYRQSAAAQRLARHYAPNGYMAQRYAHRDTGCLSRYDALIKATSSHTPWDWRWVASIIYQESRFCPNVRSPRGAYSLMQITRPTARYFGMNYTGSPTEQIRNGVDYLLWLDSTFAAQGVAEGARQPFILAAYNAGLNRVQQACARAERAGKSSTVWFGNVAPYVGNNSCGGWQPTSGNKVEQYVREVQSRYHHYCNLVE